MKSEKEITFRWLKRAFTKPQGGLITRPRSNDFSLLALSTHFMALLMATSAVAQDHAPTHGDFDQLGSHADFMDGEFKHHQHPDAAALAEKFLAEMPSDPFEALKFMVEKINKGETVVEQNRTVRLDVRTVPRLPGGALSSIDPVFEADGKLVVRISLLRSMASNPALVLETLASLNGIFTREHINFKLNFAGKKVGELYGIKEFEKHKNHPYFQLWNKVNVSTHPLLRGLGIRSVSRLNGTSPLEWAELKMNVEGGSRMGAREMAEIELLDVRSARDSFSSFEMFKKLNSPDSLKQAVLQLASARGITVNPNQTPEMIWSEYNQARLASMQADLDRKTNLAKQELREKKAKEDSPTRRQAMNDAEAFEKKLNDYVQANDRANVARLLELYIPFESMEPVERAVWKEYVDAIRNPRTDAASTVVLFRGTERATDAFRTTTDKQGRRINSGMFSTLLAKNQGNYTRRLRSFSTMRERFASVSFAFNLNYDKKPISPLVTTPKVTKTLAHHAASPIGSPFISFSKDPSVALAWAESSFAAVKIDRRRVTGNVMSNFTNEFELLVPLLVFPEEVIYEKEIKRRTATSTEEHNKVRQEIITEFEQRHGVKLNLANGTAKPGDFKADFAETYQDFALVQSKVQRAGMCSAIFRTGQ